MQNYHHHHRTQKQPSNIHSHFQHHPAQHGSPLLFKQIVMWCFGNPGSLLFFGQEQSVRNCSRSDDRLLMAEILHQLVDSFIPLFTRFYTSQVVFSPDFPEHHQTLSPFSHVQFVVPIFDQIQLAPMLWHRQNVVGTCGQPLATTSALKCLMIFSRMDNAYSHIVVVV